MAELFHVGLTLRIWNGRSRLSRRVGMKEHEWRMMHAKSKGSICSPTIQARLKFPSHP